jgi:hypothetical protein
MGNFNGGRVYETPDGRFHYFLTRGGRSNAEGVWYAAGEDGAWDRISEPVRLDMPSRLWHFFTNTTRAGGTHAPFVDCYWSGPSEQNSNEVFYGRLTPPAG